jgi:hypothetical protein
MGMGESLQFHPSPTPPQALGPRGLSISILLSLLFTHVSIY